MKRLLLSLSIAAGAVACDKAPAPSPAPAAAVAEAEKARMQREASSPAPAPAPPVAEVPKCESPIALTMVKRLLAKKLLGDGAESRARTSNLLSDTDTLAKRYAASEDEVLEAITVDMVVVTANEPGIEKRSCRARVILPQHKQFPITASYTIQNSPTDGVVVGASYDNGLVGIEGTNVAVSYMDSLLRIVFASEIRAMQKADSAAK